ncbi:hypothetical protein ACFL6G_06905 [candidate division KSB1 bacterium]
MKNCILCKTIDLSDTVCVKCGFNNESEKIDDFERLRTYHRKLNKEGPWQQEVRLIRELKKMKGYSYRKIEEKLDIKRSSVWNAVKLAEGLEKHPELSECINKAQAIRKLKEKESQGYTVEPAPDNEEEIQKYLFNNWEETPFTEKWELVKGSRLDGKYATSCGEIDLLARSKKTKTGL